MMGFTIDSKGREVGFVAFASADVPECPELSGSLRITRVRMKCTMLAIPSTDAPKLTTEVFAMGASEANETSILANHHYRLNMAVLDDISLVIDAQNIARQPLAPPKDWVPDESRPSCTICSRKFHFIARRRHHCRMCGDVICNTCYVNRSVHCAETEKKTSGPTMCKTKFCLRCVMELRGIDKQLDTFLPQVSKIFSLSRDVLELSSTETFEEGYELYSPDSNPRASSYFTFYKSDQNLQHVMLPTDKDFAWSTTADRIKPAVAITVGGIGSLVSYGSSKLLRSSSVSIGPTRSDSNTRLRGLSRLSCRNSTASIGSQPGAR